MFKMDSRSLILIVLFCLTGCFLFPSGQEVDLAASGVWTGIAQPVEVVNTDGDHIIIGVFTVWSGPLVRDKKRGLQMPSKGVRLVLIDPRWREPIPWDKLPQGKRLIVTGSWVDVAKGWGHNVQRVPRDLVAASALECDKISAQND